MDGSKQLQPSNGPDDETPLPIDNKGQDEKHKRKNKPNPGMMPPGQDGMSGARRMGPGSPDQQDDGVPPPPPRQGGGMKPPGQNGGMRPPGQGGGMKPPGQGGPGQAPRHK